MASKSYHVSYQQGKNIGHIKMTQDLEISPDSHLTVMELWEKVIQEKNGNKDNVIIINWIKL